MYQALYRKWRPKAFADVVGQEHITETLRRQVAQGRLSHAYLFTGTRGTGKTTCAKILAKAVNCQHPVDGDPCNACPACLGIDNGSLLDVLELDAASNNGVDHVRALRDEAIYSPASVKYRVYIVDEVHMLSTAAFNALLKILEEPPAHLIFILATTELHKVPATILSRCQRFAFKRITPEAIAGRLRYVAGQEGMDLTEDAAALLARLSDGALRDALSLLDQCAAQGGTIDSQRVLDVLGLAGNVQTAQLMEYLLSRDVQGALMQANDLYAAGKDVGALLGELSTLTRDLLIRMTAPQAGQALLSGGYDEATMERLSQGVTATRLIYMATQLQSAAAALPMSVKARTDAELCLIRLCDESLCGDTTALAARLSRLEEGGAAAPAAVPRPAPVPRAAPMPEQKPVTKPPKPAVKAPDPPPWEEEAPPPFSDDDAPPPYGEPVAAKPVMESPAQPSQPPQSAPKPGGSQVWQTLIERYKERLGPLYWFTLDDAIGVLEDDRLVVYCGEQVTKDTLEERPEAAQVLQTVTSEHLGRPVSVTFRVGKAPLAEGESAPDPLDQLIRRGQKFENFHVK